MSKKILDVVEYRFECAASEKDWAVANVTAQTAINNCGEIDVCICTRAPAADVACLLGERAKVTIHRNSREIKFCGIVTRIEQLGQEGDLTLAAIRMMPALHFLSLRRNSRIFQQQSALDIVKTVLQEALEPWGAVFDLSAPSRGKEKREYCVQFDETDLDFVERLLHEEGISYLIKYDPDKDCECVFMFDEVRQLPDAVNTDGTKKFPVGHRTAHLVRVEGIETFSLKEQMVSTKVAGVAWNWRNDGVGTSQKKAAGNAPVCEVFRPFQRRQDCEVLELRVADDLERLEQCKIDGTGRSNAVGLVVGAKFEARENMVREFDGEYVLTSVRHTGSCPGLAYGFGATSESSGDGSPEYYNSFSCRPVAAPLRPEKSRDKPRIYGAQTARVAGPKEGETHVDKYGRILVQFAWDRRSPDSKRQSCWIRVAQLWAGRGWGAQFIPRVGMEVVVEFLDGDPDRPLVTGTVYNGTHPPPFALPANRTQSGFRTQSSQGAEGFHELRFEDLKGEEEIYLKSQKDWRVEVLDRKSEHVFGEVRESYDRSQESTILENQSVNVGKDQTIHIKKDQAQTVEGKQELAVQGTQLVHVKGKVEVKHDTKFVHEVGSGGIEQKVKGDIAVTSQGAESRKITKGLTLNSSAGGVEIDLAKSFDLSSMNVHLKCGAASIEIGPSGININGGMSVVTVRGAMVKVN